MQPDNQDENFTPAPESQNNSVVSPTPAEAHLPEAAPLRRTDFPTDEDLTNPQPNTTTPPDYLGLTPVEVASPPKPKSKKGLFIGLVLLVVVLVVGGVLAWLFTRPTPEDRLYGAIEKLMTAQKISADYDISFSDRDAVVNIKTESDLTDYMRPKVYASFVYKLDADGNNIDSTGDVYRDDAGAGYIRFSKLAFDLNGKTQDSAQMNQWYKISPDEYGKMSYIMYDVVGLDGLVHNLVQQLIVYGLPADKASQIAGMMRTEQLYNIVSTKNESSVTKFTVKLKSDGIDKINKSVNKVIGTNGSVKLITTTSKNNQLEIWVDDKSGMITKVLYEEHMTDGSVASVSVDVKYSYTPIQDGAPSL